jgi:WD40 repeat protein
LYSPLIGHTNRINFITATDGERIYSAANDCTVRSWNTKTGVCESIFKFADPVSSCEISFSNNMMYTVSWDKMVRVVDLDANKVTKSFVAAKEAIKALHVTNEYIFVAGCDPTIRGFNIETGECIEYTGHQGWVYCLTTYNEYLLSGGDDKTIKVW